MNARLFFTALLCVGALAAPAPAGAIVNGEPPAADETRYDAIGPLGFAARVGLEGPLPTPDDTWHCTATLITPNLALTARHCLLVGASPSIPRRWRSSFGATRTARSGRPIRARPIAGCRASIASASARRACRTRATTTSRSSSWPSRWARRWVGLGP